MAGRGLFNGLSWAMNTDPAVMQASGYVRTRDGVKHSPSESSEKLADNLAVLSSTANTLTNIGMVGAVPALVSEAGAAAGSFVGNEAGKYIVENNYVSEDVKPWVIPTMTMLGGFLGGSLGYKIGYKGGKYMIKHDMLPENAVGKRIVTEEMVKDAASDMFRIQVAKTAVENQGLPHNVGWAPAERKSWWHHSNESISKFKVPFKERWDVVNHDADPNLIWLTKENGAAGMMSERPYHQQFEVTLKKPMVQVGEVQTIPGQKNTSRNVIVKQARDMGADAVIFDGIADNKLKGQQVVAVMGDKVVPTKVYSTQRVVEVQSPKNKQGALKHLGFFGMDVLNGPGQPRVVITEELLTPTRIKIKQRGGQIKPNFIKRLEDPNRKSILDWESKPTWRNNYTYDISTHKMGYEYTPDDTGRAIVYPEVQEIDGKLVDFTRPPYHSWAGYDSALDRGDYLTMKDLEEARKWVETYKDKYKNLK